MAELPPFPTAVRVTEGVRPWQVFQQQSGKAALRPSGTWNRTTGSASVVVRLVHEDTGASVLPGPEWLRAETRQDGTWSALLADVSVGGPYRLETRLLSGDQVEWAAGGDVVGQLAVGDVWVIAGQSNAAGYGKSPVYDPPELGLHAFHPSGEWRLAAHPLADGTETRFPLHREGALASHSPWLHFARLLRRRLGYPIGLLPAALGGSPLRDWTLSLDGKLLRNLSHLTNAAGLTTVRGVVWYQGESDTGPDDRHHYEERFAGFVGELRKAFGQAGLPVITVQLNRCTAPGAADPSHEGWEVIREAQRRLARNLPEVAVVGSLDCGLSDAIHTSSAGNLVLAERCAAAALGLAYGRGDRWKHPEAVEARLSAEREVTLRFEGIEERLSFEVGTRAQVPFAVRDAKGEVPLVAWKLAEPAGFVLTLGRALVGSSVVVGAPGTNPPQFLPFDVAGYRPMLGFTLPVLR